MFGGDDLFGDLPSAKNDSKEHVNISSKPTDGVKELPQKPKQQQHIEAPSLLISALGSVGTSMAFVPSALQRRKRQHASPSLIVPTKRGKASQINAERATKDSENFSSRSNEDISSKSIITEIIHNINQKDIAEDDSNNKQRTTNTNLHQRNKLTNDTSITIQDYQESSEILALHTHVSTVLIPREPHLIYDPYFPNDYLRFKQEKSQKTYRADLEASAREALEVQRVMQEQVERERKAIESTGDLDQIIASRKITGRGRGVSNLPAWLVNKHVLQQPKKP